MFSAAAAIWERGDFMWWDEMRQNKVLLSVLALCASAGFFIFSISRKAGIFMWSRNLVIFVQAILLALVLQALLLILLLSQFSDVIRLYEQHREQMSKALLLKQVPVRKESVDELFDRDITGQFRP
jgi:O-antigen/teichoic acid export membrane protein